MSSAAVLPSPFDATLALLPASTAARLRDVHDAPAPTQEEAEALRLTARVQAECARVLGVKET